MLIQLHLRGHIQFLRYRKSDKEPSQGDTGTLTPGSETSEPQISTTPLGSLKIFVFAVLPPTTIT